jgi:hypothetical protein
MYASSYTSRLEHLDKINGSSTKSKNAKNPFFRKVFTKVENGHLFSKKNVQNQKAQKSFGKKKFFFIVTNSKPFFRK